MEDIKITLNSKYKMVEFKDIKRCCQKCYFTLRREIDLGIWKLLSYKDIRRIRFYAWLISFILTQTTDYSYKIIRQLLVSILKNKHLLG
eukprot:gene7868-12338_t